VGNQHRTINLQVVDPAMSRHGGRQCLEEPRIRISFLERMKYPHLLLVDRTIVDQKGQAFMAKLAHTAFFCRKSSAFLIHIKKQ
jgi:hypothetical protein